MSLLAALANFFSVHASRLSSLVDANHALAVVVGVSGGPDSVALLNALTQLQTALDPQIFNSKSNFKNLKIEVAHLDHRLRGAEARADAAYVAQLAHTLNLPCHCAEFEVNAYAKKYHLSIEAAARAGRYAFFAHVMTERQIRLLLVAHTADDQAETVLLHLLRGSGPHGLTGMAALASFPISTQPPAFEFDPTLVKQMLVARPLLEIWRPEIEEYCVEHKLEPHRDQTNTATEYLRNRVRLQLLPLIEQDYKPGFKKNLIRLSSLLKADEQLLDSLTAEIFNRLAQIEAATISFALEPFRVQPLSLQGRLIRLAYQKLNGSLENLEAVHVELILAAVQSNGPDWTLDLPGNSGIRKSPSQLTIFSKNLENSLLKKYPQLSAQVDNLPFEVTSSAGLNLENGWSIHARLLQKIDVEDLGQTDLFGAYLDADKIGERLLVRRRKPGDKFQPLGAPGRRKLQDVLLDAKIPRELRAGWPILVKPANQTTDEQIVWVAGCTIADLFKVTAQTNRVLELKLLQEEER